MHSTAGHLADAANLHGGELQVGCHLSLGRRAARDDDHATTATEAAFARRGLGGAQDVDVVGLGNLARDHGHDLAHVTRISVCPLQESQEDWTHREEAISLEGSP